MISARVRGAGEPPIREASTAQVLPVESRGRSRRTEPMSAAVARSSALALPRISRWMGDWTSRFGSLGRRAQRGSPER